MKRRLRKAALASRRLSGGRPARPSGRPEAGQYKNLLKRLAGDHFLTPADVVTLQLAIERGAADAQHLAGKRLVTFHLLENTLDGRAFDVFQVGAGKPR